MNEDKGKFYVNAIESEVSNRIYVGQTDNLERRFKEYNEGRVEFTKGEVPWNILAVEFFQERSQSRWYENCLKRSKGKHLEWLKKNRI